MGPISFPLARGLRGSNLSQGSGLGHQLVQIQARVGSVAGVIKAGRDRVEKAVAIPRHLHAGRDTCVHERQSPRLKHEHTAGVDWL